MISSQSKLVIDEVLCEVLTEFVLSSGLITIVLPVLASILFAECLVQSGIANARYIKSKVIAKAKAKRDAVTNIQESARRGQNPS